MNNGLDSELDYPYIAEDYDPCWTAAANRTIATLTNWTSLPNGSEPSLIWYYNFMERNSNPVFLPFDLSHEEGEIRPFIKTARDEQTQGQGKRTHKRPRACVCMIVHRSVRMCVCVRGWPSPSTKCVCAPMAPLTAARASRSI